MNNGQIPTHNQIIKFKSVCRMSFGTKIHTLPHTVLTIINTLKNAKNEEKASLKPEGAIFNWS